MKCAKCGSDLRKQDLFCGECGTKVELAKQEQENVKQEPEKIVDEIKKVEIENDGKTKIKDANDGKIEPIEAFENEGGIKVPKGEEKPSESLSEPQKVIVEPIHMDDKKIDESKKQIVINLPSDKNGMKKIALFILIPIIVIFGVVKLYDAGVEQAEKQQAQQAEENSTKHIKDFINACVSLDASAVYIQYMGAEYSDKMMEVWRKHAYGGLDEALEKYKKDNKKTYDSLVKFRDEMKDDYYKKIENIDDGIKNNEDVKELKLLADDCYEKTSSFADILISPLGTYDTYSQDRINKYNDMKKAVEKLTEKVKIVKEKYGVTSKNN